MLQLDARALADVAGHQAEQRRLRQDFKGVMELQRPPARAAFAVANDLFQPARISLEKTPEVFG